MAFKSQNQEREAQETCMPCVSWWLNSWGLEILFAKLKMIERLPINVVLPLYNGYDWHIHFKGRIGQSDKTDTLNVMML